MATLAGTLGGLIRGRRSMAASRSLGSSAKSEGRPRISIAAGIALMGAALLVDLLQLILQVVIVLMALAAKAAATGGTAAATATCARLAPGVFKILCIAVPWLGVKAGGAVDLMIGMSGWIFSLAITVAAMVLFGLVFSFMRIKYWTPWQAVTLLIEVMPIFNNFFTFTIRIWAIVIGSWTGRRPVERGGVTSLLRLTNTEGKVRQAMGLSPSTSRNNPPATESGGADSVATQRTNFVDAIQPPRNNELVRTPRRAAA